MGRHHELTEWIWSVPNDKESTDVAVRSWLEEKTERLWRKHLKEGDMGLFVFRDFLGLTEPSTEKLTQKEADKLIGDYLYGDTPKPKEWPCEHITNLSGHWWYHNGAPWGFQVKAWWKLCPDCGSRKPEPVDTEKELAERFQDYGTGHFVYGPRFTRPEWESLAKIAHEYFKNKDLGKD